MKQQRDKGAMMTVQFMPTFPCFSILADDCRGPAIAETGGGNTGLIVLTDEDLLRRFREEHGAAGPTIRFEFAGQLALYLDALPGDVKHVAFDPGKRTTIVPAAELHRKLLERLP
jgi:hypothetical protein